MEQFQTKVIQTRFGEQTIFLSKVLQFPKGLIGFEDLREFILLEIKEGSPFMLLQSLQSPLLGLLVTDPHNFIVEYEAQVEGNERKVLQLAETDSFAVLVTVSIPHGVPEETTLNLSGPIIINSEKRIGLQVPQIDSKPSSSVSLHKLSLMMDASM